MTRVQFRALLTWFMCADPWPTTPIEHATIENMLNVEARRLGFDNWVVAFHEVKIRNYP